MPFGEERSSQPVDEVDFTALEAVVGERLIDLDSPVRDCESDPTGEASETVLRSLENPFAVQDDPAGFLTNGWYGAFEARHSPKAVAAESVSDIVAAVDFARDKDVHLSVKGTGHDYLGRSGNPDSLLLWTHQMREVTVHDSFLPQGSRADAEGTRAVTVQAGTRWLEVYQAVTPLGRYVQGGGCTSVGAAGGFSQGGGFGSFSRRYGTAAGNMLEAEVVIASGDVVVVNENQHGDLFWALRGGGGGTFGVVSSMTFRTHPLPRSIGVAAGRIVASEDSAFRELLRELVSLVPRLCGNKWGETIVVNVDNSLEFGMLGVDVSDADITHQWGQFIEWISSSDSCSSGLTVFALPFVDLWDPRTHEEFGTGLVRKDDRRGRSDHFWWLANQREISQYLHAYKSRWLPLGLLDDSPEQAVDALFEASRHWHVSLHLNKALAGADSGAVARDRETSINRAVFDAAALVITASSEQSVFPGLHGHEPDEDLAHERSQAVDRAIEPFRRIAPNSGSYVNETDFFEADWQRSFWGDNYSRLLEIKKRYDPTNLFRVHHGVGSE